MKKAMFSLTEIGFVLTTTITVVGIALSMNVESISTVILGLLTAIFTTQITWFIRWNKDTDNLFKKDYTKNRDRALKLISETNLHLHTTHFAKKAPPPAYTEKVIERLKHGVDVYRVVGRDNLKEDGICEWLDKFSEFNNYHQTVTNKELPFDVTVFDGKKTILYFPSHPDADDFDLTLYIENEELSKIFMMLFSKIKGSAIEYSPMNMPKGSGVWLKDAYHVPYLVVEGVIDTEDNERLHDLMKTNYREIDLNNIGKCYAMDNNNKAIFCIDHNRCALCYFISGEATEGASYMEVLTSIRSNLDSEVLSLEELLVSNNSKIEFTRIYLQDPARHVV